MDFDQLCEYVIANTPPDNEKVASAFYNTGNDIRNEGNLSVAIQLFEKSLEYEDDNPSAYNNIASIYKMMKKYDLAESYYKKALEVNPDYRMAYLRLAMLYAVTNQKSLAIDNFNLYVQDDPSVRSQVIDSLKSEVANNNSDTSIGAKELLSLTE